MKDVLFVITEKSFMFSKWRQQNIGIITDGDLGRKITVNFVKMKACPVMEKNHKVMPSGAFV